MLLFLIITSRVYALSNILGIVMICIKFCEIILICFEEIVHFFFHYSGKSYNKCDYY